MNLVGCGYSESKDACEDPSMLLALEEEFIAFLELLILDLLYGT